MALVVGWAGVQTVRLNSYTEQEEKAQQMKSLRVEKAIRDGKERVSQLAMMVSPSRVIDTLPMRLSILTA